jgi:hypothetical protein
MARLFTLNSKKFLQPLLFFASCLSLVIGCQGQETPSLPEPESTPEAKFARFEADLRRRCQEASGSLMADNAAGLGTTSVRTVIDPPSCVWHAPQTPDGKYTAEVTFVTRMIYASSTPVDVPIDEPSRIRAPGQKKPLPTEEDEKQTTEPTADSPVRKLGRQEEFRDTYDLVYRENRWVLASREVPESMKLLLNRALEAQ